MTVAGCGAEVVAAVAVAADPPVERTSHSQGSVPANGAEQSFADIAAEEMRVRIPFRPDVDPPPDWPRIKVPSTRVEVPEGSPQPLVISSGWTYDVPPSRRAAQGSMAGWTTDTFGPILYKPIGDLKSQSCDGEWIGLAGVAGYSGTPVLDAAVNEIELAEHVVGDDGDPAPTVTCSEPIRSTIGGLEAARVSARVADIVSDDRGPSTVRFEVVAVPAFSNREVMVLMVMTAEGLEPVDPGVPDTIFSSLRRTDGHGN
ncbi:hypothetical protein [Rhodococcus triatomae]|uniref:hypothetical protein n=1 Tax=Rhodococcus triatomae TaxID=300028 RepID=UPI0011141065|nr:hypothetical protein [Rhodococcus triatomae]